MKKRLFAGALALLMIIGLLPVSSMLKKPVEAQAAADVNIHRCVTNTAVRANDFLDTARYFKAGSSLSVNTKDDKSMLKFSSNSNSISFTVSSTKAKVIVTWYVENKKGQSVGIKLNGTSVKNPGDNNTYYTQYVSSVFDISQDKATTYTLSRDAGTLYLYQIEVIDDPEDYLVTVDDSKATDSIMKNNTYNAGETVTLSAANADDFRYWENSEGIIVSRSAEITIPIYYNDTYKAVYKNPSDNVVNYLTPYGQVLYSYTKSEYKDSSFTDPNGPIRYGYAFEKWSSSAADSTQKKAILSALDDGSVDITPVYNSATGEEYIYDITIDTTAFGGKKITEKKVVNEVVTATVSSDDFAYWEDENGNVVSYSPTYLFFANRTTTVKAVKGPAGKDDKDKAVITNVYTRTSPDGSPVAIFEYNVPDGYNMDFAGVVASQKLTGESLTVEKGAYVIGDSNLAYTTYRYTLTSTTGVTWNIKPMLKYTYNGTAYTIYGDEITLK